MPTIPRWVLGYTAALTVVVAATAVGAYVSPSSLLGHLPDGAAPAVWFYGARNAGFTVALCYALWKRGPAALAAVLTGRFVVDLLDLLATLRFDLGRGMSAPLLIVVWVALFLGPQAAALRALARIQR